MARDAEIAALAARQHGVVARRQLLELGLRRGGIEQMMARARLHRVHRGVYAVGHPRLNGRGRWMAAVLACGPDAVLSHRSAAALWGIASAGGTSIDVSVGRRGLAVKQGVALHQVRWLPVVHRTEHDGIPVTRVARTLYDLAEVLDPTRLERAFEEAERMQLLDLRPLQRMLERSRGRRGLGALRRLVAAQAGPAETRSELERRFLDHCRTAQLPRPQVNQQVLGFEVDAVWPSAKLVVELDGFAFHRTRAAFERDRARDATLQLAGFRVLRITHRRLLDEPGVITETVRRLLAAA